MHTNFQDVYIAKDALYILVAYSMDYEYGKMFYRIRKWLQQCVVFDPSLIFFVLILKVINKNLFKWNDLIFYPQVTQN